MQQEQAQQLFEAGGFFILPLDKQGTEFGIDGSLWAVKQDSFAVSGAFKHSRLSSFAFKSNDEVYVETHRYSNIS